MTASKVGRVSAGASDIILNGNRVKLTKMFLRLIKEDRTYCQSSCIYAITLTICHVMGLAPIHVFQIGLAPYLQLSFKCGRQRSVAHGIVRFKTV